ncbi:MAG: heme ABC exporter ATP-binding protein CcmA [Nocardioidaceae bacterium]|nr:heme ABC exporter ATP-binding protein CcmA [Nocardioidaceae bacterium]
MSTRATVTVNRLRVRRGRRYVIPDLSAEIRPGQITGLLGPSGCGKTTLMRAIVGVQKTHGGSVEILGEPAGSPSLRRRVGYVTQAPSVYGDLTVRENLRFFAAVLGVDRSSPEGALATVGLSDVADDVVAQLSGGQRSRVSLGVALLSRPDLLILDEPTVGLDPVLRRQLWSTFADLASEGTTVMVSSHVMDEAARCDRLLLMRDGALIADDEPQALLAQTSTSDVESAFLALVERETSRGD